MFLIIGMLRYRSFFAQAVNGALTMRWLPSAERTARSSRQPITARVIGTMYANVGSFNSSRSR
jgi:hypothetical protein